MSFLVNPYWYGGCDPDAVAFLTAAGITDATISAAICTLVTSMKANGTWAKCIAIYPFVGNTASQQKWNLKDPRDLNAAFRLSFVGGWTHSANGALPNGTNAYADTFLIPKNILAASNHHLSLYSRTDITNIYDMGSGNVAGTELSSLFLRRIGNTAGYDAGAFQINRNTFSNSDSRGFFNGSTVINTQSKYFKNGVLSGTKTLTPANLILGPVNLWIGAFNEFNTINFYSSKQCAFASIGSGLSDAEAASLYTDVQAFQTTLGRQV